MRPLLLLDCYLDPAGARSHFAPWMPMPFDRHPAPFARETEFDITRYQGVVITGSAGCLADPEPWMDHACALVQRALRCDIPILGICFGHQLLAFAAAGPQAVEKAPKPEIGFLPVHVDTKDPLLRALPSQFHTFVSHEDHVRSAPALEVIGHSAACPVHAIRVAGHRAWGIQFHLEYPRVEQERILRYRAEKHPQLALDPDAILATAADTRPLARALFSRFGDIVRA